MKSIRMLMLSLLLTITSTAMADWTGEWSGPGAMSSSSAGDQSKICPFIQLSATQTGTQLTIAGWYFCNNSLSQINFDNLEIRTDQLWKNGRKVGSVSDTSMEIERLDFQGITSLSLEKDQNNLLSIFLVNLKSLSDFSILTGQLKPL